LTKIWFIIIFALTFINKGFDEMKKVEVGSKIPMFELHDQDGNLFKIEDVVGKKNLVIYFYPKDDTPGCTKEACTFRDSYEVFEQEDAMVIGISGDSVESHKEFARKYNLNFTLLSDKENKVRNLFGVPKSFLGLIQGRVTYVVNKQGVVVLMFDSQLQAEKHVEEALKILKKLH
jgi:peroxiredoxin Q/BCP